MVCAVDLDIDNQMERIKIVEDIRIKHPRFNHALKLIQDCHQHSKIAAEPQCLLITAPSGAGKTTLFRQYVKMHDKIIYGNTRTKRVILSDEVPSPTRLVVVVESLLEKLGDPFPLRGTLGNKRDRLIKLIKDCQIELIMLDEFQHFVNSENNKLNYEVAEWFKSLVNITNKPFVLFGLEESRIVMEVNEQLDGRFSVPYHLHPFSFNSQSDKEEFRRLVDAISKQLPFEDQPTFAESGMATKLMYASDGTMRRLMNLIRRAARIAIERNHPHVDENHFSEAFELFTRFRKEYNPFLINDFEFE
ncbi:TniB family NTP-binding protein [Cohnella ginsengisoli]|uniref:TniB family NTP-binding protein n=1 Tax=Cohnella ginsengisoli TaxID=425004 RepID=A0A9X4KD39_9BACL|nr:TniB family NTP-binding protein [Cohnella ginsengisoli]MDG0789929.1 TniB family NTP-binding protein [Cohnella ginsengisoli]